MVRITNIVASVASAADSPTCLVGNRARQAWAGEADLFIVPGYRFRVVDALVTNFHQPRSMLLALVSAFASRQRIVAAYAEAIRSGYRFFSFDDATQLLQAWDLSRPLAPDVVESGSRWPDP